MANTRRASRRASRKNRRNTRRNNMSANMMGGRRSSRRGSRRASRRGSRRNTRRNNMMGGRAERKSRRGVAGAVYAPVGALARGTGRTVGTAAKAGIKLFENLVSGADNTVRAAASTINSTFGKIIPKTKKAHRRH